MESLYELGKRYGQGDGVDKDLTKAFNNFRKAAEGYIDEEVRFVLTEKGEEYLRELEKSDD